ncbi:NUDIX domain-containing protein [Caballeronia sp. LZ065]|uniref:NUDIX hydrolase n=1 Tax=Caballeronia sp. LZ065 TaxID=3038571 RepID=UPI00285D4F04|nr:NUDIX domain-containing protein [Caballeronia sp. LZ065]MDR5781079.1 NUDIX domain-containing protein [Caballeronia sp. LZ065]
MKQRATVIVERDGRVLLVARARGRWAFPGGRAKASEELDDAASRELKEETGLEANGVHYAFQFRGLRTRHFVFIASVSKESEPVPANEIVRCSWMPLEDLCRIEASIPTKGIAEIFLKQMHGGKAGLPEKAIHGVLV